MTELPFKIVAWKKSPEYDSLNVCETNDPDAIRFDIQYFIKNFGTSQIEFKTKWDAQVTLSAMVAAFDAGRRAHARELRVLLDEGVK